MCLYRPFLHELLAESGYKTPVSLHLDTFRKKMFAYAHIYLSI